MLRGRLYENDYKPKLSGHETFPLRYGWLKKALDAVSDTGDSQPGRSVFLCDDAIARFGVGKNMVASMRHWAVAVGVIEEERRRVAGQRDSFVRHLQHGQAFVTINGAVG